MEQAYVYNFSLVSCENILVIEYNTKGSNTVK